MPRQSNQKLKLLYLMRILLEQTDENNVLTAPQLVDALSAYDVPANRKSIYDDIEALRLFGLDVILNDGKGGGYFIGRRDFELPELKLLVDAVQSSRLITSKKSSELINKLSKLTSRTQARQLNRHVYVAGRAKALNESIYYSIDNIHTAVSENKKISFKYFRYDTAKQRVYRKSGEEYIRTPVALCWSSDNYYLITYSPKYDHPFASFRVDRMEGVEVLDESADNFDHHAFNIIEYTRQTFGMYSGTAISATLAFDTSLVSNVIDQFGSEVMLIDSGNGRFTLRTDVSASGVFLAWIAQFGDRAEIIAPDSLRDVMRDEMEKICKMYD